MADEQPTYSNIEEDQIQILIKEKNRLEKALKDKKNQLSKLNLVKLYRVKNDLSDLDSLVSKWREASQEAVQELYDALITSNQISMGEFLQSMNIDANLIRYNEESESFIT